MMRTGVGLSAAVTTPIVKAAKDMYKAGTDFEAQMSKVQAIAGLDSSVEADAAAIEALTQKALYMGSTTEWTATQAGEALEYMAMAGWREEAMIAGLESVMHLATAAGSDLGTTSDIVTDAMTAFGLTMQAAGGDTGVFTGYVEHFTDVLAAAATSSNTNVELLGTSFKYVAPLAGTLGMSVDDVAVALGLMANSGIKATMSGAAMRNILSGLMGTTDATAAACETLGLSLYDEHGQAKDLMTIMMDLRTSYKANSVEVTAMKKSCEDLDAQLAAGTITQEKYDEKIDELTAGSSDFMRACVKLAGKQGLSGLLAIMSSSDEDFETLRNAIGNCDGATAQMAATMLDNARGAATIFKSAMEGLEITLWTLISDSFTGFTNKATEVVQAFQQMDRSAQSAIMKFMGLSAAAGPVLIAGGKLVKSLPAITRGIAGLASPMGIVAAGLALFAVAAIDADNTLGKLFTDSAKKAKTSLQKTNKTIAANMGAVSSRMGALCQSIVEGLGDIIPEAAETVTLVLEGFLNAIGDNASSIADIGKTVIVNLLNGISSALPRLIPAAASMITNIATSLADNFPAIVEAAGGLINAFIGGIVATDWVDLATKIVTSIQGAINSVLDISGEIFNETSETLSSVDWASVGTQIIDLILNATVATASSIGTFLTNLIDSIGNYTGWSSLGAQLGAVAEHLIVGIADAIPGLTDVVVKIIDSISTALSGEGVESLATGFKSFALSIIDGLTQAIPKVGDSAASIVTALANMLNGINWDGVVDCAVSIGTAFVNMLVVGIKSASDVAGSLVNAIASLFNADGLGTNVLNGATQIATALVNAVADAIPTLTDVAKRLIEALGSALSSINWASAIDNVSVLGSAVIDAIIAGINGVSEIGVSLVTAIGNMLSNIDWNAASDVAGSFATSMINGIVEGLKALTNGASLIMGAISEMLGNINWADLGDAVSSFAQTLFDGITESAKTLAPDMTEVISAIGRGLEAAMSGLGELAGNLVGHLVQFILSPDNWLKLVKLGGEIVKGIATGIKNLAESVLKGAWSAVSSVFTGLFDALGLTMSDEAKAALDSTAMVVNGEGEMITQTVSDILSRLREMGTVTGGVVDESSIQQYLSAYNACLATGQAEIIDGISEYSFLGNEAIVNLFQLLVDTSASEAERASALISLNELGLGRYISNEFASANGEVITAAQALSSDAVAAFQTAFTALGYVIPDAVAAGLANGEITVQEAADQVVAAASVARSQASAEAAASDTGAGIASSLSAGEAAGAPDVQSASEGVVDVAEIALATLPDVAAITGEDAVSGMAGGIENNADAVTTAMDTLSADVVAAAIAHMSYDTGYQTGYDYASGMNVGIGDVNSTITATTNSLASAVTTAASSVLNNAAGVPIGYNFALGIASGISRGASLITAAAAAAALAAVAAAKRALVIGSPSRLARDEIGYMYDEGLAGGIYDGLGEVRKAAAYVSQSMHDAFYVGDTSRGTVYSARRSASETAVQTARQVQQNVKENGTSIDPNALAGAVRNALEGAEIIMDDEAVGRLTFKTVSELLAVSAHERRYSK